MLASFCTFSDPVDRFISAFYWRSYKLQVQKVSNSTEEAKMFVRYNEDANLLAESLCSQDKQTCVAAKKDMALIGHSKHSIADWLLDDGTGMKLWKKLAPVVLEIGYSLEAQVDAVVEWANHHGRKREIFEDDTSFGVRRKYKEWADCNVQEKEGSHHTSAKTATRVASPNLVFGVLLSTSQRITKF